MRSAVASDPWVQMFGVIAVVTGAITLHRFAAGPQRPQNPDPQQLPASAPAAVAVPLAAAPVANAFPNGARDGVLPDAAPAPAAPPQASAAKRLPRLPGRWVVDASGGAGADVASLAEALAAASDGDEIRLRPGRYGAGAPIGADVSIIGEGNDPAQVVLEARGKDALRVEGGRVRVSGLTFSGSRAESAGLVVYGKAAVSVDGARFWGLRRGVLVEGEDASVSLSNTQLTGCAVGLEARGGAKASVVNATIQDGDVGLSALEGAQLTLSGVKLSRAGEGVSLLGSKTRAKGSALRAVGGQVAVSAQGGARFDGEQLELSGQRECALKLSDSGTRAALEQARISDAKRGVCGSDGAEAVLTNSSVVDSGETAVALERGAAGALTKTSIVRSGQSAVTLSGRSMLNARDVHVSRSVGEGFMLKEGSSLDGDKLVVSENTSCAIMIEDRGSITLRGSKLNNNLCGVALYRGGSLNLTDCDLTRNANGHFLYKQQHRGEIQLRGSRNMPPL